MKTITLLGSTGSIGRQALDVCERLKIHPKFLSANSNMLRLAEQIAKFSPERVAVGGEDKAKELQKILHERAISYPEIVYSEEALCKLAAEKVDRVLVAISGFAALKPVYAAILAKNSIALANKEAVVVAADLLLALAKENKVDILPVDSEHSAIWQCLAAAPENSCRKIYLTASGGPFLHHSFEALKTVTAEEALAHPVWDMGAKISIDSATMFNKGLELIEAMQLFQMPEEAIEILVHSEGIVHSLTEFHDGSILAQLSYPDMRIPIQLALTWPKRMDTKLPRFDFFAEGSSRSLVFEKPDEKRFPALKIARKAARMGKEIPLVMNAANEIAVQAFLENKLSFFAISQIVEKAVDFFSSQKRLTDFTLDGMIKHDQLVREWTEENLSVADN